MIKKLFATFALLSLLAIGASAQTITTVTGTVVDPSGVPYANATVNITLVPPAGGVSPFVTATGSPVVMPTTPSTSAAGVFSTNLVANASITPSSTTYSFRVCAPVLAPPLGSGLGCVTLTGVTITGASQDLTVLFSLIPPPLLITPVGMQRVASFTTGGSSANISATTIFTTPTNPTANFNGTYRLTCYTVISTAATTSSTLPACNLIYTDYPSGASETIALTTSPSTNAVGAVGAVAATAINIFAPKPGTVIQVSTTGYASSGATAMAYTVYAKLEFLGAP